MVKNSSSAPKAVTMTKQFVQHKWLLMYC